MEKYLRVGNSRPDWVLELMKVLAQKMVLLDSYYAVCVYEAFTSPGKHYVSETVSVTEFMYNSTED
jgi:hypothetical protein